MSIILTQDSAFVNLLFESVEKGFVTVILSRPRGQAKDLIGTSRIPFGPASGRSPRRAGSPARTGAGFTSFRMTNVSSFHTLNAVL